MNLLADDSLPGLDELFPTPFSLTRYHNENELRTLLPHQEFLLCRSTLKVTPELLKNGCPRIIATASSGTDHLDVSFLKNHGIQVIDAKGSNASSVADYVRASLAYLDSIDLLSKKKAGVIGMGYVGQQVALMLSSLGYEVLKYDPLKTLRETDFKSCELEALFSCDLICVHAELHNTSPYPSLDLIDDFVLSQLKSNCIIINAARGGIVNETALLQSPKKLIYCTDVFIDEPEISKDIVDLATLCTPHIAGHSVEAKYRAVLQISQQLHLMLGLAPPKCRVPTPAPRKLNQDEILSIYNPLNETNELKRARDIKLKFLELRKAHTFRHDFI